MGMSQRYAFGVAIKYVRDVIVRRVRGGASAYFIRDLRRLLRFPSAGVQFMKINEVETVERVMVLQVVSPVVLILIRLYLVGKNVIVEQGRVCVYRPRFFRVIGTNYRLIKACHSLFYRYRRLSFVLGTQQQFSKRVAVIRFVGGRVNEENRYQAFVVYPSFKIHKFRISSNNAFSVRPCDFNVSAQDVPRPLVVSFRVRYMRFARRILFGFDFPDSFFEKFR